MSACQPGKESKNIINLSLNHSHEIDKNKLYLLDNKTFPICYHLIYFN